MNESQMIAALVVVIIGICQAVKYAGIKTRWIPLLAIILGIAGSLYIGGVNWISVLAGIVTAFIASGAFSAFKRTILNK